MQIHEETVRLKTVHQVVRSFLLWIVAHELWLFAPAGLLMLFPRGWLPYAAAGWLVCLWLCRRIGTGRWSVSTGVEVPLLFLILTTVLGFWISVSPQMSSARAWAIFLGIGLFFAAANQATSEKVHRNLVGLLALITLGMALVGLFGTNWSAVRLFDLQWLYSRLPVLFRNIPGSGVPIANELINPRPVGLTMGALLPVFLALVLYSKQRGLRILSGVVVLVGGILLLLSQALQGISGLLVGAWIILVWRSRWWLLLLPAGLAVVAGVVWWFTPEKLLVYLLAVDNPVGIAIALRLDMWGAALRMIQDMPFTGVGLNTFPIMQSQFYVGKIIGPNEPHAHNLFLQTALDLGIPGLLVFFWLLAAWTWQVVKNYRLTQNGDLKVLLVGGFASLVAYLVGGIGDVMTLGARQAFALWLLLALCMSVPGVSRAQVSKERAWKVGVWLPAVVLLVGLAGSLVLFPQRWMMNWGVLLAHQALYQNVQEVSSSFPADFKEPIKVLEQLEQEGYQGSSLYALLGELYAWEGKNEQAVAAFSRQIAVDLAGDYWFYYLPESLLVSSGAIPDRPAINKLRETYYVWNIRYPDRASYYLLVSLLDEQLLGEGARARERIAAGIKADSKPIQLLEFIQRH